MLTFLPYGEPFQRQRKLVQQVFTKKGCLDFRPSQMHETHVFMKNLLKDSVRFQHHIERYEVAEDVIQKSDSFLADLLLRSLRRSPTGTGSPQMTTCLSISSRRQMISFSIQGIA